MGRCGHSAASTALGLPSVLHQPHGHHGQLAVGAPVQQMHVHVAQLAPHRLLAGVVEVELDQLIAHAASHDVAAGVHMRHDGVAVVLQRHRPGDVVKLDGRERLVQVGAANVQGRLLVPLRAGLIRRVQLSPDQRAGLALVAPIRSLRDNLRGRQRGHAQCKSGNCNKTHEGILGRDSGLLLRKHSIRWMRRRGKRMSQPRCVFIQMKCRKLEKSDNIVENLITCAF
jgi:hypothetical protein